MGARSGQMSYFTETEYSEVVEDCSSMSLAAEYSGNVKFGLEASADTCKSRGDGGVEDRFYATVDDDGRPWRLY